EDRKEKKYRVTRWQSELPLAVAGFAFGDYKVRTEAVGKIQVEVYANKRPDDALRGLELTVTPTLPGQIGPTAPVALGSLAPGRLGKVMAAEVGNSLRLFEKYFGPYPYKKLAVTNIPANYSYGQGWPSLLYIWAASFLDSTQRHQLGIRDHVRLTDFFRAHETSHQWWGHAVGWKSYHDQWLSEGFAEFSGILYTMYRRNPGEYFRLLRKNRQALLTRDREGIVPDSIGPIYTGVRLNSGKHPGAYSNVIYNKGGWVLHMLRMLLYDPRNPQEPDHRFIAMMQDFTRTFHNQPASTEDFKAIVEKHMTPQMDLDGNGKMDWFFESWVYGTGVPEYKLHYEIEPAAEPEKLVLKGMLRQSGVPEGFRTLVPFFLHQGKRSWRAGWFNVRGPETPFEISLGFKPDKMTINDWEDVLSK
ncbi:MAG: M1 family aminopeptidase, partial [Terriglobia bacterium]